MVPQLLLIAAGTLVSEDLTCIATGVLIAQGKLGFIPGAFACLAGIFVGDMLLFLAGRLLSTRALRWPGVARLVRPAGVERAAEWLEKRGLIVILLSRFTPGMRLPTYFAAGVLPTRVATFAAYFFVASLIWTPALVAASAFSGQGLLRGFFASGRSTIFPSAVTIAILAGVGRVIRPLMSFSSRRRLIGSLKRIFRWEFWPAWLAYVPLVPYFLCLAIRYRSLTLFTAVNPGIPSGGLMDESKSQILAQLRRAGDAVPAYELIPSGLDADQRIASALAIMQASALQFPVVLKPDVGERGSGVAIIRSEEDLVNYLSAASGDLILQAYVEGLEFGIFYYRFPHEPRGRIASITSKVFPSVTGDGRSTLRELILRDSRAVCLADIYAKLCKHPLDSIPYSGEAVQLVEIGSHCRGAIFLDASSLTTAALETTIDRLSKAHPGFYFGRFDIRVESVNALQRGESIRVIELNGVSAENTHIYDPEVSLWSAYRVMFWQWRTAFAIAAANRDLGARPMTLTEVTGLIRKRLP